MNTKSILIIFSLVALTLIFWLGVQRAKKSEAVMKKFESIDNSLQSINDSLKNEGVSLTDTDKPEFIIFGFYAGYSPPPYSVSFKFNGSHLYVDTTDSFGQGKDFRFELHPLSDNNLPLVRSLMKTIPASLMDKKNARNDCTQCYDAGGTYLLIRSGPDSIIYHTNCETEKCPEDLKYFLNKVDSVSTLLIRLNKLPWH